MSGQLGQEGSVYSVVVNSSVQSGSSVRREVRNILWCHLVCDVQCTACNVNWVHFCSRILGKYWYAFTHIRKTCRAHCSVGSVNLRCPVGSLGWVCLVGSVRFSQPQVFSSARACTVQCPVYRLACTRKSVRSPQPGLGKSRNQSLGVEVLIRSESESESRSGSKIK